MDLISRRKAMEAIISLEAVYADDAIDILRSMPSAQPEQRWIPVSERLPEKAGKYLVTVQNGNVYAGTFDAFSGRFQCAAIAWMALPEPYREEEPQ